MDCFSKTGEWMALTLHQVRQVVLLHVLRCIVEADVIHLCGQEEPAVHGGSQQGVDARRSGA